MIRFSFQETAEALHSSVLSFRLVTYELPFSEVSRG